MDYKKVKDFWDQAAKTSGLDDKTNVGMLTEGNEFNSIYRRTSEHKHFLELVDLNKSMRVLEVGSGGGRWSFFLADKVESVVGIDFSQAMVDIAMQGVKENKVDNVHFYCGDMFDYQSDVEFDLVYFSGVLQYVTDDDLCKMVQKAKALLKSDGYIISRDSTQELRRVTNTDEYPVVYRMVDEYRTLFEKCGYNMDYTEVSYVPRRFSQFISKFYSRRLLSYRLAFYIQTFLISINNLLGNPRFLMKDRYKSMLDSAGCREHRFFRYIEK
jgi:ubiquinone/menaquinone biosynthesis C-methylase UbiE